LCSKAETIIFRLQIKLYVAWNLRQEKFYYKTKCSGSDVEFCMCPIQLGLDVAWNGVKRKTYKNLVYKNTKAKLGKI
jgi:hypothetical protein